MRTTIDIPDEIYRRLKIKAVVDRQSIRQVALRGILREIDEPEVKLLPRLTEPILKAYAPGSIDLDNEQIYDLIGFP
jgi:2-phosphoglycerate kinase